MNPASPASAEGSEVVWGPFMLGGEYIGGFVRILDADGYTVDNVDPSIINSRNSDELICMAPIIAC